MTTLQNGVLQLYLRIVSGKWLRKTCQRLGGKASGKVYGPQLVMWLMIWQRLAEHGTLTEAVGSAIEGNCGALLGNRQRRCLSPRTGAYCRARQRLSIPMMSAALQELTVSLQRQLRAPAEGQPQLYILDGSTLQLPHQRGLLQRYPPAENQHGKAHWPVVRIVVLHDAHSGLAVVPAWGAMYGVQAVSEQALAQQVVKSLPAEAVVIGDRNFGVFRMVYAIRQQGCGVLFRLTESRARSLAGPALPPGSEQRLLWRPTRGERRRHPDLPPEASVEGRLLVFALAGFRQPLYLFTTWEASREEIFESYGLRWNIETDLRTLKRTVRLHRVVVKTEAMLEKELLAAIAAYNLVRTVMSLAVPGSDGKPRELSFTHTLTLVQAFLPKLLGNLPLRQYREELHLLLRAVGKCRLPRRTRRRSFPRAVWSHDHRFPDRHEDSQNGK